MFERWGCKGKKAKKVPQSNLAQVNGNVSDLFIRPCLNLFFIVDLIFKVTYN